MRSRKTSNGMTVQAIAGTHVVLLGWDVTDSNKRKKLLGFAVQRTDHTEKESFWLRGMKTFPDAPKLPLGGNASTNDQPFQGFQWGDYTAKAGHEYTYKIVPKYGTPDNVTDGASLDIDITTEEEWGEPHSVFFNRGAIASQEYVRRFGDKRPAEVGEAAYAWLARGLLDALLVFIRKAKDNTYGFRAAIYEFQWQEVLLEFKKAKARGVDVEIIYDAIDKDGGPVKKNQAAITAAKIKSITTEFTNGTLMHNKFIVLTRNGKPIEVWTGSTNITENGIFGHLNCGHAVKDPEVAKTYLNYWETLHGDPGTKAIKQYTDENAPPPSDPVPSGITAVFSPQSNLDALNRYAEIANSANSGLFMTFAFGMNKLFLPVYEQNDKVLRFALMEKEGNGAAIKQGRIDISRIRKLPNVLVALGHNIKLNMFDRWVQEPSKATKEANVLWVHTKFMLVDPLSDDPIVVTGSANFSDNSIKVNEENLLVIRGDKRVADIYLGEFMRSFAHYAFREAVYLHEQSGKKGGWEPQYLTPDDSWLDRHFKKGSAAAMKRTYFSGQ